MFVLPGQGAQYPGMGEQLYQHHRVFARTLDEVCAALDPHLDVSLREVIFAPAGSAASELLGQTAYAQPALFAIGVWLAVNKVPEDTALYFSLSETRVGGLTTWYVRLTNASVYAFDVEFTLPRYKILQSQFHPASTNAPPWRGLLLRGALLEALFVLEGPEDQLSPRLLESLLNASYQERDEQSGALQKRKGLLREAGAIPLSRTIRQILWFFLPIGVAGIPLILARMWRWWRPAVTRQ